MIIPIILLIIGGLGVIFGLLIGNVIDEDNRQLNEYYDRKW